MPRRDVTLTVVPLHAPDDRSDLERLTAAERLALVWQLTRQCWELKGEPLGESRLPRHVVRVVRGEC